MLILEEKTYLCDTYEATCVYTLHFFNSLCTTFIKVNKDVLPET